MLSFSNISVIETLQAFKLKGIPVSFLVPTRTGLEKSIMDATKDIRIYLESWGLHDFAKQQQGANNKSFLETELIVGENVIKTKTSLYRPKTKDGDPRIWIYGLSKYAKAGDLLALASAGKSLIIINCSETNLSILPGDFGVLLPADPSKPAPGLFDKNTKNLEGKPRD